MVCLLGDESFSIFLLVFKTINVPNSDFHAAKIHNLNLCNLPYPEKSILGGRLGQVITAVVVH